MPVARRREIARHTRRRVNRRRMKPPPSTRVAVIEHAGLAGRRPAPGRPADRRTVLGGHHARRAAAPRARAASPCSAAAPRRSTSQFTSRSRTSRDAAAARADHHAAARRLHRHHHLRARHRSPPRHPAASPARPCSARRPSCRPTTLPSARRRSRPAAAHPAAAAPPHRRSCPAGTKQMSWLSGLAATGRPSRAASRAHRRLVRHAAQRETASAQAARAWWRTGTSSGRAPGRRRGAVPAPSGPSTRRT